MKTLILGGARSGKSRHAEQQALATEKQLHYVATATGDDGEMRQRINHHKSHRSPRWQLHEVPLDLSECLQNLNHSDNCILIDCLTLWLSNCLHEKCWPQQQQLFLQQIQESQADLFLVSNEVGSGIVPLGKLSREFVDHSGWLHQQLAESFDEVKLVVAGQALTLKGKSA
jgi:adenosylcobinamide kinase / adenosylcobinamide-phosphate guanylyltransferase